MYSDKQKIILVDDEPDSLELTSLLLSRISNDFEIIGKFSDALLASKFIDDNDFDLLFLDIDMPELNGFEFLTILENKNFELIFLTAHDQFALRAFKESAFDYLLKPLKSKELKVTLDRYTTKKTDNNPNKITNFIQQFNTDKRVCLATNQGFIFQEIDSIEFIKAESEYSKITLVNKGKEILISKNLGYFEKLLEPNSFLRVHRSYLVNMQHVCSLENNRIKLKSGYSINLSRSRKATFYEYVRNNTF